MSTLAEDRLGTTVTDSTPLLADGKSGTTLVASGTFEVIDPESVNATNSTDADTDTNKILADLPLRPEKESNSTTEASPPRSRSTSESKVHSASSRVTVAPVLIFLLTTPKAADKHVKILKNAEKKEALQKVDTSNPLAGNSLREVFTAFDSDGNDQVSFHELKKAVHQYGIRLSDKEIHEMIRVADLSGEGLVDFGEFTSLMKRASS